MGSSNLPDFSNLRISINRLGSEDFTNLAKKLNSRERYIMLKAMEQITETKPNQISINQKEVKNLIKKLEGITNEKLTKLEKAGNIINYLSSKALEKVSPVHQHVKSEILASNISTYNKSPKDVPLTERPSEEQLRNQQKQLDKLLEQPPQEILNENLTAPKKEKSATEHQLTEINEKIREAGMSMDLNMDTTLQHTKLTILENLKLEKMATKSEAKEQNKAIIELNDKILSVLKLLLKRESSDKSKLWLDAKIQLLNAEQNIKKARKEFDESTEVLIENINKFEMRIMNLYDTKITKLRNFQDKISEMSENKDDEAMIHKSLRDDLHTTELELQKFQEKCK